MKRNLNEKQIDALVKLFKAVGRGSVEINTLLPENQAPNLRIRTDKQVRTVLKAYHDCLQAGLRIVNPLTD